MFMARKDAETTPEATRARVMAAAAQLFAEKGFDEIVIRPELRP